MLIWAPGASRDLECQQPDGMELGTPSELDMRWDSDPYVTRSQLGTSGPAFSLSSAGPFVPDQHMYA